MNRSSIAEPEGSTRTRLNYAQRERRIYATKITAARKYRARKNRSKNHGQDQEGDSSLETHFEVVLVGRRSAL